MISVLLVDDDPSLLDVGRLYIEREGEFSVYSVSSAEEAIGALETRWFDAVVSDYQMPGTDGIELLRRLRGQGNSIPFIIFTGRGREHVVIEALNIGADFYLQKGGDPKSQFAELKNAIRQAVQRKRAEDALLRSESMYRSIVENTGSACIILEEDTTISLVNADFERLSGFTREEVEGKLSWTVFVSPDDLPRMRSFHDARRASPGSAPANYEFRFVDRWGNQKDLFLTVGIVPGTMTSVVTLLEITERRQIEDALRERESEIRSLVDGIPDILVVVNDDGDLLFANPAVARFGGLPLAEKTLGRNILEFVHPSCRELVTGNIRKLRAGSPCIRSECLIRKAGGYTWVEGIGRRIQFRGSPANLIMIRDIAERKGRELKGSDTQGSP